MTIANNRTIRKERYFGVVAKIRNYFRYMLWIYNNEKVIFSNRKSNIATNTFRYNPKISIVMPVYQSPLKYLRKAVFSVIRQSYQNWELIIIDDCSGYQEHIDFITDATNEDERIIFRRRSNRGNISLATNDGVDLATGEYVAFLDHDDMISRDALFWIVSAINKNKNAKLIYSDEDKIDRRGIRFSPHFKCEWNKELFYSQNYICHLLVIRKILVTDAGGLREGFEGAQDYDLILRIIGKIDKKDILHIPRILYHWRSIKGSTAYDPDEKSYAHMTGKKALQDHLIANQIDARVMDGRLTTTYRIQYALKDQPSVTLIIPTRDQLEFLLKCVDSILTRTTYPNYHILIVDNDSKDEATKIYLNQIEKHNLVSVLTYSKEFNFSAINNYAVSHIDADIIGLVNNDIEVITPGWINEFVSLIQFSEIGCVGAKLIYPNNKIQHAGIILGIGGVAGHSHKFFRKDSAGYFGRIASRQDISAVTGACLFVRKKIYDEVEGFDENLEIAFNDVDFGLKVRQAGYRNIYTPYAELYHHESISRGKENTAQKVKRFNMEIEYMQNKWGRALTVDPYYNPNLSLSKEDFSLSTSYRI